MRACRAMRMHLRWPVLGMLCAGLACDGSAARPPRAAGDAGAEAGDGAGSAGNDAGTTGAFMPASCTSSESAPGVTVSCGFVQVPERHEDPSLGTIKVRVAILAGQGPALADDPIVYLDGGAGGSSVAGALYYAGWAVDRPLKTLLSRRRIIAVDLRGAGGSIPNLGCEAAGIEPLGPDSEGGQLAAAVGECRRSLMGTGAGANLGAYGTQAAAADVAAVAVALGLRRYDLVGSSYGARVALELLRGPAAANVRAVVLDSLSAPGNDVLAQEGANLARALEAVVAGCEARAECQARAPALRTAVPEIVGRLGRDPQDVSTHGGTVTLDDRSFLQALAMSLREGDTEDLLPTRLQEARTGDLGFFAAVLGSPRGRGSLGAHLGVMCAEHMAFTSPELIEKAAATVMPPLASALYARYYALVCPVWAVPPAPPALRAAVSSAVPALLLAGGFDPVTSAASAREAAATLAAARVIELPLHGHAVIHRTCGAILAGRFLENPTAALTVAACSSPE
jgi:pimeloyl-ACP methyl ester carboxylesterase